MVKHTLKILRCEHRKIFKVCLAIFQHYAITVLKEAFKRSTFIAKFSKKNVRTII